MDRNGNGDVVNGIASGSLSARRAWIEMIARSSALRFAVVALRKESVDRNVEDYLNAGTLDRSLSARRAWIEIIALRSSGWI